VGLFACINDAGLRRYGMTRKTLYALMLRSLRYAKDIGLNVRFTIEDASRTDRRELREVYRILRGLGADRLSYADTVGVDGPGTIARLPHELGGYEVFKELHFHFHDDLGRAHENAETAAGLGARCLDVSVLGIGERSGIPSLRAVLARTGTREALASVPDAGSLLNDAELLVSQCMNYDRYARRKFAHKSGIHIHGVLQDPAQYEAAPSIADGVRSIVLSKLVGRTGLRTMLSRCRIPSDGAVLEQLLERVKADEFLELADREQIERYLKAQYLSI
jgi:isopropylmalate/homocitrate/citramalate synthase